MAYYFADKFELDNDTILIDGKYQLPKRNKYILIGDSYANRDNSWQDRFVASLQIPLSNVCMRKVSGSSFTDSTPAQQWQTILENSTLYEDGTPIVPEEVTDIIVCGGYNDRYASYSDLNNAMGYFRQSARSHFPNAVIYVGFIAWSCNSTVYNALSTTRANYKVLCDHFGYTYLNGVEWAMHMGTACFEDNLHPNETGRIWLSRAIKQAYLSGSWFPARTSTVGATNMDANVTGLSNGDFTIYMTGEETVLRFNSYKFINFVTPVSSNTWIDICELENTPMFGNDNAVFKPVPLNVRDSNGDSFPVIAQWRIVRSANDNTGNALIKLRLTTMGTGSYDRVTMVGFDLHYYSMDQI